jgi:hypothetical protein
MNGTLNRLDQLEARFERLRLEFQDTQRKLTQALQQIRDSQAKYTPPAGDGAACIFSISPIVIPPGSSVTGQTVYALQGGSQVAINSNATIYNQMAAATVATSGKTILVSPNGDGSFTAVTQSC